MSVLDTIQKPIENEMRRFSPFFKETMRSKVPLLSVITNYIIRGKGKQMRPMFVFLSAKLCGQINPSTYNAAAMIEMLHTATLIHDDVVDNSDQRRGIFSIKALWRSKIAVLVGDYLLAKGMILAVENEEYALLKIISNAVREMSEGELLQIEKARRLDIDEAIYFEVIRKKTAVLIASCTEIGSKSVGAANELVERMRLFGEYIGIAFQIRDDIFDYQKTNLIGKPTGNDIQEKKMTLPLIYALNQASILEKREILKLLNNNKKDSTKIERIVRFVVDKGGLDYAQKIMLQYHDKAIELLAFFQQTPEKIALLDLVDYTVKRKK
jgi:octaprenyl-diphosphate synthase